MYEKNKINWESGIKVGTLEKKNEIAGWARLFLKQE